MASQAALSFRSAVARAELLCELVGDPRLSPQTLEHRKSISHAALTANVAAWNAYITDVLNAYLVGSARPSDLAFSALHTLNLQSARRAVERFNTPNWENCRNLLVAFTGYDPINDWVWPARNLSALQTKERLNEILKVRHSFAHGFPIPAYSWTQTRTGQPALSKESVRMSASFLGNLVNRTDMGLLKQLKDIYGIRSW